MSVYLTEFERACSLQTHGEGEKSAGHGNYVQDFDDTDGSVSVLLNIPEKIGSLAAALDVFKVGNTKGGCCFVSNFLTDSTYEYMFTVQG